MILNAPIKIRIMAFLNVLEGKGYFSLRIRKKAVFSGLLILKGNNLILRRKKRRLIIKIIGDASDEQSVAAYLRRPLARLIFLDTAHVYFEAGKADDAFVSAMLTAAVKAVVSSLFAVLRIRYLGMNLIEDYRANYEKNEFELTFNGIISCSIADIIVGLFMEALCERPKKPKRFKKLFKEKNNDNFKRQRTSN